MDHHDAAVRGASERYSAYPGALALVLGGSVAHGTERADSDIDLTLVLTEDAYAQHATSNRISFSDDVPEYYDHAYFDVKVVTLSQLALAAESGDDPTRASYIDGRVLWAVDEPLSDRVRTLLAAVVDPPESHWLELEVAFLAQARLHGHYFLAQAEQLDLALLRHHAAVHFAFALGRTLLARNRVLFAGPKYLESALGSLAITPPDFASRLGAFLDAPTPEIAAALLAETEALGDQTLSPDEALSRFVEDNELAWRTGRIPPEYR